MGTQKHVVLTRKAAMTMGALHGFLRPKLAADAKLDLSGVLARVTSKNFAASKPQIISGVQKAIKGKLAQDASVEGLATLLDALEEEKGGGMDDPLPLETEPSGGLPSGKLDKSMDAGPDHEVHEALKAFLADKLSPEDMAQVESMISSEAADEDVSETKMKDIKAADEDDEEADEHEMKSAKDKKGARDEPPPFKGMPKPGGEMVTKDAMNKAIKAAQEEAVRVREAERFVRPWVGDLAMAHDSAEKVYKTALDALNVDVKDVHPSAYKRILEQVPLPSKSKVEASLGMDAASVKSFAERYPDAARIKFA